MRQLTLFERYISTQKPAGTEKSLPLGVVPRAANKNLYDCRWQSYHYYKVSRLMA